MDARGDHVVDKMSLFGRIEAAIGVKEGGDRRNDAVKTGHGSAVPGGESGGADWVKPCRTRFGETRHMATHKQTIPLPALT